MNKKIERVIFDIHRNLEKVPTSLSLMNGVSGSVLFRHLYHKHLSKGIFPNDFYTTIEELAHNSTLVGHSSFCNGRTGIQWLFSYLFKNEIFDEDDWQLLCEDNNNLCLLAIEWLKVGNFDFLHGATGIVYQMLYLNRNISETFYKDYFAILDLAFENSEGCFLPSYSIKTNRLIPDETNLSLSHGITSILKFCLECFRLNICREESSRLARKIIDYLITYINSDKSISFFPNKVNSNASEDLTSRLAWCYGDLSIGFIIYQASLLFSDFELRNLSLEILRHNSCRRESSNTRVCDSGFCHGSSGIAHIFNKVWKLTDEPIFKEACDFWIKETIERKWGDSTAVSFSAFNPISNKYERNFGLLEGEAGIGLVLISYLTGDFSWDYCFMLN